MSASKQKVEEKAEIEFNYTPSISSVIDLSQILMEQFKGEIEQKTIKFPKELGEEHPFDFKELEELYKKFGFFTAVVDKYVDFVIGPGFYVECGDERALKIIEDFIRDVNLDTILRAWTKEALVKGNGFLEIGGSKKEGVKGLKVLNANYMYVVRNKVGKILRYNQYKAGFDKFTKEKIVPFDDPESIAHFAFNVVGDNAYGQGIGYAALKDIDNILSIEKDEHFIMKRKANSPLHAKLGKVDGTTKIIPKSEDVTSFGQKMETMNNKTDWATDALVELKVVDFGNMGDKFNSIREHDMAKLFYDFQVPPELMGMANIPEGMAEVRMDAFERRIQSIQAEEEKVIEEKIFNRVLEANGFDSNVVHVEFQWGRPSTQEKSDRLTKIKEFMGNMRLSDTLFKLMEKDVVKILDYPEDEYEADIESEEIEKQKELERTQPLVPGQNANPPQLPPKEKVPQPKAEPPKAKPREAFEDFIEFIKQQEIQRNEQLLKQQEQMREEAKKKREEDLELIKTLIQITKPTEVVKEEQKPELKQNVEQKIEKPTNKLKNKIKRTRVIPTYGTSKEMLDEGWVTGDDGRHYYIDDNGESHGGKDAMDYARIEGGKKTVLSKIKEDNTNKLFKDGDTPENKFETHVNVNEYKSKLLSENKMGEVNYDSYTFTDSYSLNEDSAVVTGVEESLAKGENTPMVRDLKINKEINKEILTKKYGDEITLYRGVGGEKLNENEILPNEQFYSWSSNKEVAEKFAYTANEGGKTGKVIIANVPVDNIWASHITDSGIRHLNEEEFIVFHKKINFKYDTEERK